MTNAIVRKHVVISGTGRTGTSFLVQLLTRLGLETGFTEQTMTLNQNARAGLEWDLREANAPHVVKSPYFCDHAEEVVQRKDLQIEHVLIPVRDLRAAAESRRFVLESAVSKMPLWPRLKSKIEPPMVQGGLFNTKRKSQQESVLLLELYKLVLALSSAQIPVTLLQYPMLVQDSAYLFRKLEPILGSISYQKFADTFAQTVRPEWVHSFPLR